VNDLVLAKLKRGARGEARQGHRDEMKQVLGKSSPTLEDRRDVGSARTPRSVQLVHPVVENEGHTFGESLSDADKNALIAFLATL